jgi:hypothetical protein
MDLVVVFYNYTHEMSSNTSTLQLPSEFSSTDGFSAVTEYLTTSLLGNMINLEESLEFPFSNSCLTHTYLSESESESYIMTDVPSASLSWNKAPIWGLRPDFYYCLTVAGLLIWGALSDEWTGPSFTIAAGPHQRSHFRVRVP